MKLLKSKKGFTLIELIVVIVILGIIAGVATPKLLGTIQSSKINTLMTNIATVENNAKIVFAESGGTLTTITEAQVIARLGANLPSGIRFGSGTAAAGTAAAVNASTGVIDFQLICTGLPAGTTVATMTTAATANSLAGAFTQDATTATTFYYRNQTLQ